MGGRFNRSARSFANLRYAAACLARDSFSAGSVASLAIRSNWSACSRYSPTIFTTRHPPSNTRSQYGADARGINMQGRAKKEPPEDGGFGFKFGPVEWGRGWTERARVGTSRSGNAAAHERGG